MHVRDYFPVARHHKKHDILEYKKLFVRYALSMWPRHTSFSVLCTNSVRHMFAYRNAASSTGHSGAHDIRAKAKLTRVPTMHSNLHRLRRFTDLLPRQRRLCVRGNKCFVSLPNPRQQVLNSALSQFTNSTDVLLLQKQLSNDVLQSAPRAPSASRTSSHDWSPTRTPPRNCIRVALANIDGYQQQSARGM